MSSASADSAAMGGDSADIPARGLTEPSEKRLGFADPVRVLAMLSVVMVHCMSYIGLDHKTFAGADWSRPDWWVAVVLNHVLIPCTPLFVMLSGALLLDPSKNQSARDFFRRRLIRVGFPLLVWSLFYTLWPWLRGFEAFDGARAIKGLISGQPYYHLYFLFNIVGLYVFTPWLRLYIKRVPRDARFIVAAVTLMLSVIELVARNVFDYEHTALSQWMPFLGFFLLGYELRDYSPSPRALRVCATLFVASLAIVVMYLRVGIPRLEWDWAWYIVRKTAPTGIVMSITAYIMLKHAFREVTPVAASGWRSLAELSFGVFLIHPIVLDLVPHRLFLHTAPFFWRVSDGVIWVLPRFAVAVVISAGATYVIRLTPGLRRIVG